MSVCRKAHYSPEFLYLWRREQLGPLLGAAGRAARASRTSLQELVSQTWLHNSLHLKLQWDSNASSLCQGGAAGTEGALLLGMQHPGQEFCIINWSRYTHYYLHHVSPSATSQDSLALLSTNTSHTTDLGNLSRSRELQEHFSKKSFAPLKTIKIPLKILMNSSQICQSQNQINISNILEVYIPFSEPVSIHGLKKGYFSLKFV